jgi:hypothetical protein
VTPSYIGMDLAGAGHGIAFRDGPVQAQEPVAEAEGLRRLGRHPGRDPWPSSCSAAACRAVRQGRPRSPCTRPPAGAGPVREPATPQPSDLAIVSRAVRRTSAAIRSAEPAARPCGTRRRRAVLARDQQHEAEAGVGKRRKRIECHRRCASSALVIAAGTRWNQACCTSMGRPGRIEPPKEASHAPSQSEPADTPAKREPRRTARPAPATRARRAPRYCRRSAVPNTAPNRRSASRADGEAGSRLLPRDAHLATAAGVNCWLRLRPFTQSPRRRGRWSGRRARAGGAFSACAIAEISSRIAKLSEPPVALVAPGVAAVSSVHQLRRDRTRCHRAARCPPPASGRQARPGARVRSRPTAKEEVAITWSGTTRSLIRSSASHR